MRGWDKFRESLVVHEIGTEIIRIVPMVFSHMKREEAIHSCRELGASKEEMF